MLNCRPAGSGVTIYILISTQLWFSSISTQHHYSASIITETYIIRLAESCRISQILFYNFIMSWWRRIWNSKYTSSARY